MSVEDQSRIVGTDSFLIELPVVWEVEEMNGRVCLVGPNNDSLIITSILMKSEVPESYRQDTLKFLESEITELMIADSKEPDLIVTQPLNKKESSSGKPVWSIYTNIKDSLKYYNLYCAIGYMSGILVTLEGEIEHKNIAVDILRAINEIEWH